MKITSTAFENQQVIPEKYTCKGAGVNPPLQFVDIPSNTKTLVLIVEDPDAPNGTFIHWVLYNIDPFQPGIIENSTLGTSGLNSSGKPGYFPPCPPSGTHHYIFKLYALDMVLEVSGATAEMVNRTMQGHIVGQAELVGVFGQ